MDDDEYLSAILLTHAHADHYQTLVENIQDGAEVIMTPATASILETVLSEASKHSKIDNLDWESIEDSIKTVTDWYELSSNVKLRPVPAGHVPGACSYLIQFDDDKHILSTGDFTFDRAAGYPPIPENELSEIGIDILFLNSSTSQPGELTESIDAILEQAISGSDVLVTASGMTCVKYVYLLGHLIEERDINLSVSIAGQAAKIYDDLDYDVPNVTSYPVYESTDEVLESDISVAGPEKPEEGSSKILFDEIKHDPSATLVRILAAFSRSMESASCTVMEFKRVNHPTEDEMYKFIEDLNPVHTVIQHGGKTKWGDVFDFTLTWADDETVSRVLYSNGDWEKPGWLKDETYEMILRNNRSHGEPDLSGVVGENLDEIMTPELPSLEISEEPDLEKEGVELDEIAKRDLHSSSENEGFEAESKPEKEVRRTSVQNREDTDFEGEDVSLRDLKQILERIEKQFDSNSNSETYEAFVVDTGEGGDLLVRIDGHTSDDLDLEHGQIINVSLDNQKNR
ncbi:MBL fold metallo-hydrolase (plasmid) [Halorutilales archaeon Cl-col2-1]